MIYTIGRTDSYKSYFESAKKDGTIPEKLGRDLSLKSEDYPNGYLGGSVWKDKEQAQKYAIDGYSVFGVLAEWNVDTVPTLDLDFAPKADWHDLIKTSELVIL